VIEETTTNEEAPALKGFWSLQSDEESLSRGQINFLAVIESISAIIGFCYVSLKYETFFPLYTSLFIAPLLFLRSEASVRQGATWFNEGLLTFKLPTQPAARESARIALKQRCMWIGAGIGTVVSVVASYPLATLFLVSHDGEYGFQRGLLFCLAMTNFAGAGAGSISIFGAGVGSETGAAAEARELASTVTEALYGTGAVFVMVALAGAVAGTVAGTGAGAGAIVGAFVIAIMATSFGGELGIFFIPGYIFGIWACSVVIRIIATTKFLLDGYMEAPLNIERLAFRTSPFHLPELMPGLSASHYLSIKNLHRSLFHDIKTGNIIEGIVLIIIFPIIFIPGWIYRFVLKSTLIFWWILYFVGGAPRIKDGIDGLRADAYRKAISWILLALAAFSIAGFFLGTPLTAQIKNHRSVAPLLSSAALLFLVDWSEVHAFQWVTIISSVLTLSVALWTHSLVVDRNEVPGRAEGIAKSLPRLGYLVKWKSAVGALSIALTMLYFGLYANALHGWPVSPWAASWLQWLYGGTADALLKHS